MFKKVIIGISLFGFLLAGIVVYVSQPLSFKESNKLLSSIQLNENTWSYILVNNTGGATVPIVYRMYLTSKIDGPDIMIVLKDLTPVLISDDEHASVKWDGSKFLINSTGKVFKYTNKVVLPNNRSSIVFVSDSAE